MEAPLTGLRSGVRALRVPRGILLHDPLRWRLFQVPAALPEPKLRAFLQQNGVHESSPEPARAPRLRQIFLVALDQLPSREFIVHPEARFSCVACGTSCRTLKLGPMLRADVERLSALDWSGTAHEPSRFFVDEDDEPLDPRKDDLRDPFLRRDARGCQFLRDDNLCEVHARFGAAAKPLMCRMFPFHYRATPHGIAVAMRVAECTSAPRAMLGTPVLEQRQDLADMLAEHEGVGLIPPAVWFTREHLAPYEEYARLEAELLSRPPCDGFSFACEVFRAFEPDQSGPASAEALRDLASRAAQPSKLPVLQGEPRALEEAALRLEESFCRLTLFNKELFLHQDLSQAAALFVIKTWLNRRNAPEGTAAAIQRAWKASADRQLREICRGLDVRALAAALAA